MTVKMVFLVVIGAVMLVTGTTGLNRQRRLRKAGMKGQGRVLRSRHIQKRDEDGHLIQNYYELQVEYSKEGHRKEVSVNSIDEYCRGDQVHLTEDVDRKQKIRISGEEREAVFAPGALIICGMLIAALPLAWDQLGEKYVSGILSALLFVAGAALIMAYVKAKCRKTEEIEAEIDEVLKWQPGTKKKWYSPAASYYPVIKYETNGEERRMRSRYNSSTESFLKKGKKVMLYRDIDTGKLLERGPRKSMIIGGCCMVLFSFVGIYSTTLLFLGQTLR